MKKSNHTPIPWKFIFCEENKAGHPRIEIQGDDVAIADLWGKFGCPEWNGEQTANAEFIIRAVNSHEEFLEQAKEAKNLLSHLIKFLKFQRPGKEFYPNRETGESCINRLETLIARAEGKSDDR